MRRLVLPVGSGDRAGATPRRPDVTSTALDPDRLRIVLAAPSRAGVAGASVVAGLPTGRGVPVVAGWDEGGEDGDGPRPWATPRTRRAVAVVQGAGVDAVATGNTVRVVLPADETQAVAAVERLTELPDRGPLICVVARAWNGPFLRLVERRGTVSVSGPSASVAACRTTLRRHGVEVVDAPRPTGAVATALLRAGWTARGLVRTPTRAVADAFGRADVDRVGEDEAGQALLLVLLGLTLALILAGVLGAVAMATSGREDRQRAVDVAALAAAAHLRAAGVGSVTSSSPSDVRGRAVAAARSTARENGAATVEVDFPQAGAAVRGAAAAGRAAGAASEPAESTSGVRPTRVRVRSAHRPTVAGVALGSTVAAIAEVATPTYDEAVATGDEYAGPLAIRQGKPMRPDVAQAFDRMNAAATVAGHPLTVTSGYRSNAEQARLFAAHPDPKWVARPGTSLHRMGTELDLGPPSAYGWLAANSERFGFRKRYSWEPWHFGFIREVASAHVAEQGRNPAAPQTNGTIPPWVPAGYRDTIRAAAIRFKVSAAMLSAQLKAESNFDPRAVSSAGARGIAQFMPGTAAGVGLRDPFDPTQAIPAQARLMSTLLRRFGSVPLALAAYNAGEGRVGACHCIPPYPETQQYVARIIALMRGYDDGVGGAVLAIRLVE